MIKTSSTIEFTNVLMKNIICANDLCSGGAMLIINSQGTITDSTFDSNYAESNGGSLSVLNLSGELKISNSYFQNSKSGSENGGGISFITDQNTNFLILENSYVLTNYAKQGGGIYYEF